MSFAEFPLWLHVPLFLLLIGLCYYAHVLVHELGHLAMCLRKGVAWTEFRVGPALWRRDPLTGAVAFGWSPLAEDITGGHVRHVADETLTRRTQIAIILGGPVASLLLGLAFIALAWVAGAGAWLQDDGPVEAFYAGMAVFQIVGWAIFGGFLYQLITPPPSPIDPRKHPSDGDQLWPLLRRPQAQAWLEPLQMAVHRAAMGKRPNPELLPQIENMLAERPDVGPEGLFHLHLNLYSGYFHAGDMPLAKAHLEALLNLQDRIPAPEWRTVLVEAAFFFAEVERAGPLGRRFLERAAIDPLSKEATPFYWAAALAVARAEGDFEAQAQARERLGAMLASAPDTEQVAYLREFLARG